MVDFALSEEQHELQSIARRFALDEVRPIARRLDREQDPAATYPRSLVRRASELGLRTLSLPRELGGRAADTLTQVIVLEELSVGDAGFAMGLIHAWREGLALYELTTDEQRERFLPAFLEDPEYVLSLALTEPHSGSDNVTRYDAELGAGPRTTAVLDGDEWVVNGLKRMTTNGNVSRMVILIARTDETVPWTKGVSMFLVPTDTPGFRAARVEDKLGLRLNQNAELRFENCRLPRTNLLGEQNRGLDMLAQIGKGSLVKEAVKSLGIARAAYEEACAWTRSRVQGGKPIAEHQAIGAAIVKMATDIEAARALAWRTAWAVDNDSSGSLALEGAAKVHTADVAVRTAVTALELHGSYGVLRDNYVEKLVRDAVTMLPAFGGGHAVTSLVSQFFATGEPSLETEPERAVVTT